VWRYRVLFAEDAFNVNFGLRHKTLDGVDVAGLASDRELVAFDRIRRGTVVELSFDFRLHVAPGTYLLNAGVGGIVDDRFTYLARRVDVAMIRVLSADSRPRYGIAELDSRFRFTRVEPEEGK
jgi:hypothetical protein